MTFRPLKRMLLMGGFVLVGAASAVFLTTSEPGWHPAHGTLWQSHYWLIDIPGGALGLEEWRLEGINTETSVYLGSFHFSTFMPALVVAAIGLLILPTVCFLCVATWRRMFSREYDTHTA